MDEIKTPAPLAWHTNDTITDQEPPRSNLAKRESSVAESCRAMATDFDGTVATGGVIDEPTIEALKAFRKNGRKVILVTGRELADFALIKTPLELFDLVIAENGGVLYTPSSGQERVLGNPPDTKLIEELRRRGVAPLSVGRVILATWEPHETTALEVIKQLGVGYNVIFNKGAVMLLPAGIDKAFGLKAALEDLQISTTAVIGFGDAENDHAFLRMCGFSVAVSNAIPAIKNRVDVVTSADRGRGVTEFLRGLERTT